jgi:hypothetical protein
MDVLTGGVFLLDVFRDFVFSWPAFDFKIRVRLKADPTDFYLIVPMVSVTLASPKFPFSPPPPYTVRDPAATTADS